MKGPHIFRDKQCESLTISDSGTLNQCRGEGRYPLPDKKQYKYLFQILRESKFSNSLFQIEEFWLKRGIKLISIKLDHLQLVNGEIVCNLYFYKNKKSRLYFIYKKIDVISHLKQYI